MVQKGYFTILPYHSICHYPHLKLSPAGVVPQCTRHPWSIMDYSFTEVNHHSLPIAPTHSMQMGYALQRILQTIAYANPAFGPPLLCKFDLSDGYYHVPISPKAALELAIVKPGFARHKSLVALLLCLPMGWKNSPPYFCAFTESIADIANASIQCQTDWPPHSLEGPSQDHLVPQQDFQAQVLHPPSPPFQHPIASGTWPPPSREPNIYSLYFNVYWLTNPMENVYVYRLLFTNLYKIGPSYPHLYTKPQPLSLCWSHKHLTILAPWMLRGQALDTHNLQPIPSAPSHLHTLSAPYCESTNHGQQSQRKPQ